jgi:rod shape-determining protein MreD
VNGPKVAAVVLAALVLQVCLLARFSFDGARPDVMVLLAVAAGFVAGPERGAIVGFAAGLAFDVVLATPFGLSALVYTLVGYAVGVLGGNVIRASWWISPLLVAVASAAAMVLYALVGEVLGQATLKGPPLTAIVVVVSALNAVLAPLAIRAVRWAAADQVDRRRHPFLAR